jgi:hypothetical protein
VPAAYTYNPSYSGGRDQEDRGSKLAPGKQLVKPYLEKIPTQEAGGVGLEV